MWGSAAQGFSSSVDAVEAVKRAASTIIQSYELDVDRLPGLKLDDPETVERVQRAVDELRSLPAWVEIGGKYADRFGF